MRLLIALDALLSEGSVGGAARRLELSDAATSRMLGQIRTLFNDPILVRSSRRMIATPRAEKLRARLRRLSDAVDRLLQDDEEAMPAADVATASGWQAVTAVPVPRVAFRRAENDEAQLASRQLQSPLDHAGAELTPSQRLARYIAITGSKAGQTRPLSQAESRDAFSIIFGGNADAMQISALLSLIHYRGETADELAGMVRAARERYSRAGAVNKHWLDWPCYQSPNSSSAPWFMQAAKLVSHAGIDVVLHGSCGQGATAGRHEQAATALGIPLRSNNSEAVEALASHGIVYLPLAQLAPQLRALMALYPLFHSRSPINNVVPLLNPLNCSASLLGMTQTAYRELHRDTAQLLGQPGLAVASASRDVAQLTPHRLNRILRLRDGVRSALDIARQDAKRQAKPVHYNSFEYWQAVWSGAALDDSAITTIIDTAAVALLAARNADDFSFAEMRAEAAHLWARRLRG